MFLHSKPLDVRKPWVSVTDRNDPAVGFTHQTPPYGFDQREHFDLTDCGCGIRAGLIWPTIQIDSTGRMGPVISHGHQKEDARRIRDRVEQFQQRPRIL